MGSLLALLKGVVGEDTCMVRQRFVTFHQFSLASRFSLTNHHFLQMAGLSATTSHLLSPALS
jgi:hypothetical protein